MAAPANRDERLVEVPDFSLAFPLIRSITPDFEFFPKQDHLTNVIAVVVDGE